MWVYAPNAIRDYYRDLQTDVRFVMSIRDPRAVLTSIFVDKLGYCVPTTKWRAMHEHIQYQRQFADVLITEYRDLVERPGTVQQRLGDFTGCRIDGAFDQFHSTVPGGFDTRALNGVRPLDRESLDKWRGPEHRGRIQQVLHEIPELPQLLIDLGYESDTAWTSEYR